MGQRYSSTKSIGTEELPRGRKLQFVSSAFVRRGCPWPDIPREICDQGQATPPSNFVSVASKGFTATLSRLESASSKLRVSVAFKEVTPTAAPSERRLLCADLKWHVSTEPFAPPERQTPNSTPGNLIPIANLKRGKELNVGHAVCYARGACSGGRAVYFAA